MKKDPYGSFLYSQAFYNTVKNSFIILIRKITSVAQTYLVHVPMEGLRSSSISSMKQQCPDTDVRAKRNRTRTVRCVGCVPYQQSTSK